MSRNRISSLSSVWIACLLSISACEGEEQESTFDVAVTVESDPGMPLGDARVDVNGQEFGRTAADGTLALQLRAREGAAIQITVACPAEYRSPVDQPPLILRRVGALGSAGQQRTIVRKLLCPPVQRRSVLLVRAAGRVPQRGLPVVIDGHLAARTDDSGVAHVALQGPPGSGVHVRLPTGDRPIVPSDPERRFTFPDQDDVFVFDAEFEPAPQEELAPVTRRRRRRVTTPPVQLPQIVHSVSRR